MVQVKSRKRLNPKPVGTRFDDSYFGKTMKLPPSQMVRGDVHQRDCRLPFLVQKNGTNNGEKYQKTFRRQPSFTYGNTLMRCFYARGSALPQTKSDRLFKIDENRGLCLTR